jgi:hypothetical protein
MRHRHRGCGCPRPLGIKGKRTRTCLARKVPDLSPSPQGTPLRHPGSQHPPRWPSLSSLSWPASLPCRLSHSTCRARTTSRSTGARTLTALPTRTTRCASIRFSTTCCLLTHLFPLGELPAESCVFPIEQDGSRLTVAYSHLLLWGQLHQHHPNCIP